MSFQYELEHDGSEELLKRIYQDVLQKVAEIWTSHSKFIRHFKQIIFFNSSLQFRNSLFYTSKVRNSLPALIPNAVITF